MRTRKEAVELISRQLEDAGRDPRPGKLKKGHQFHYGTQELRELLDFLYGGPPEPGEELAAGSFRNR